jgi:GntR family transcriptional regulator of arabinose operon
MALPAYNHGDHQPFVPLYEQLVEQYREAILSHVLLPGDRVDSITEIQRRHRVSRETAKRVLRILCDEGLIVQRAGKGSFVADLRPKQAIWGLVFPFHSIQYEDLIARLGASAAAHGRTFHYFCDYNRWEEEVRLVAHMLGERYEAVVVVPTLDESRTWDFYSKLSPQDSPVILFDHTMSYHDFAFVVQSYDLGVVRAMNYLLTAKPGRVAFVASEGWGGRNMVLELMHETYREVLRTRRPDLEPLFVDGPRALTAEAVRREGITGVFCCDDVCAVRVIGRLREQGMDVPGDLNVVSYGNSDIARYFTPAITSVDPHNGEMVRHLETLLQPTLDGKALAMQQHVVQPELVVRQT